MVFPYLSADRFRDEIPFSAADLGLSDTEFTDVVQRVLERESRRVERFAGAPFEERAASATLDGTGTDELPLENRPVRSVVSLEVRDADGSTVTIATANVWVYDTHLLLGDDAEIDLFPELPQNVDVEYTYGYSSASVDDVDEVVREGVLRLARKTLAMIEEDGITQESEGDWQMTYEPPRKLRRDVYNELQQFRPPEYSAGVEVV